MAGAKRASHKVNGIRQNSRKLIESRRPLKTQGNVRSVCSDEAKYNSEYHAVEPGRGQYANNGEKSDRAENDPAHGPTGIRLPDEDIDISGEFNSLQNRFKILGPAT
jgi:hypothetical protein